MIKKILVVIGLLVSSNCYADASGMAQDILTQIIHGPVNGDPNLDDLTADKTVILSLKSAMVSLACQQINAHESSAISKCITSKKPQDNSLGKLSSLSVDVGNNAAAAAIASHRELIADNYAQVINYLQVYINNLNRILVDQASVPSQ